MNELSLRLPAIYALVGYCAIISYCEAGSVIGSAADGGLKRRATLGIELEPVPDDRRRGLGLPEKEGLLVKSRLPGSPAQPVGIELGDVIISVDGNKADDVSRLVAIIAKGRAGEVVDVDVMRAGKRATRKATLQEFPRETDSSFDVVYDVVTAFGGRRRTIITKPKDALRHPVLMFIQGLGNFSVDDAKAGGFREIIDSFARAGYVTLRVDKPGMGDSEGGPCEDTDFETELDGYRQALKALKQYPFVEPDHVFILGHSMGGVFGPIIAGETQVKGVIVYGTVFKTWIEYELENARRQLPLAGLEDVDVDRNLRKLTVFLHELHNLKRTPEEIKRARPELTGVVNDRYPDGVHSASRHYKFWQQLGDVSFPAHWRKVESDVLVLWGKAEFVSTEADHAFIAKSINQRHPGRATFMPLDNIDHFFKRRTSMEDSLKRMREEGFNPTIVQILRGWIDAQCVSH